MKILRRSLFIGTIGRGISGATAFAMLILTVSGIMILVCRMSRWRALLDPPTSSKTQTLQILMGQIATVGLLVASVTGIVISLATFGVLPAVSDVYPMFPIIDVGSPRYPSRNLRP